MTIRRTAPSRQPASSPRTDASSGTAEKPSGVPGKALRRRNSSLFETALPRVLLNGAAKLSGASLPQKPTSNGFVTQLGGRNPPVSAGSFFTQLKQAAATAHLALSASDSVSSGGTKPPDFAVASKLRSLSTMPLTNETDKVTQADYFSQIAGVKPEQAYDYFVNNPNAIFGAANLKVRPAATQLKDGARLMLEQAGSPSVWFPIEVHLDASKHQINITTLDGHPLRGTNNFSFTDDGQGGTRVSQLTRYQLSSKAIQLGMGPADLERQHNGWKSMHSQLFEHFYPRS